MSNTNPQHIANAPIGEDQFKGQSHKRISSVIANEIRNGESRMIGLDGGWGAGKSNLIRLVDKDLNGTIENGSKNYPVIVYDAWGHIADLQRRSILEEVTNSLIYTHKALGESWIKRLDELLAKKKATRTKKMPALSTPLITLLISVILVPLMNYFTNIVPAESFLRWLIPLLFIIIVAAILIGERWWSMNKHGQEFSFSTFFGEMFMLYQGKISEDTTYEVVAEQEPSSSQFKKWIHDIDESFPKGIEKVVLVFDNLDRLPCHKVQEFWAAIHSFFAEEKFRKISVVVPFDRAHVVNAFRSENDGDNSRSYGDDFINKTFDVVYRVSPLILSDWKSYFNLKWEDAFGKGNIVPDSVTQIYDALSEVITPRDIISFINEYVSIIKTSTDDIPGQYVALFIFGEKYIDVNPQEELLKPSFLGSLKFLYENDNEVTKYLSALYYQLPVEDAMDIVFTRQCQLSLDNNTPEQLANLAERTDIFMSIIENAILNVSNIENVTLCLNSLDLRGLSTESINRLWNCVYRKLNFDTLEHEELKDYQFILLKHIANKQSKNRLAISLVKGYRYAEESNPENDNYVKGVRLLKEYDSDIAAKAISPMWKISAELFVRLVERAGFDWHTMALDVDVKDLDNYMATLEIDSLKDLKVIPLITELNLYNGEEFEAYKKSLRKKISANNGNLPNTFILLERLKEVERPISDLNNILSDNTIYNLSESVKSDDDSFIELLTIALSRGTSYSFYNRGKINSALQAKNEKHIKEVANRIEAYVNYGDLLGNKHDYSNFALGKAVISEITALAQNESICDIKKCLLEFDNSVKNFELNQNQLFNNLSRWECEGLSFSNDEMKTIPLSMIKQAIISEKRLGRKICKLINNYLNSITQEEWLSHLKNNSHTLQLYLSFKPTRYQALVDAVFEIVKNTIKDSKSNIPISSLEKILNKMVESDENLESPLKSIVDFIGVGHGTNPSIFVSIAPWVFKLSPDCLNDIEKFERFIPSEILSNASVLKILQENQVILSRYRMPDSFRSKLKQMAETTHKNNQEFMKFVKGLEFVKNKED